jgi:hypothetical protein
LPSVITPLGISLSEAVAQIVYIIICRQLDSSASWAESPDTFINNLFTRKTHKLTWRSSTERKSLEAKLETKLTPLEEKGPDAVEMAAQAHEEREAQAHEEVSSVGRFWLLRAVFCGSYGVLSSTFPILLVGMLIAGHVLADKPLLKKDKLYI